MQATGKCSDRMRVCAGWSEPLLVAHTTLFEISCCVSFAKGVCQHSESSFFLKSSLLYVCINFFNRSELLKPRFEKGGAILDLGCPSFRPSVII